MRHSFRSIPGSLLAFGLPALLATPRAALADANGLEEVIVTATLRTQPLLAVPNSITVLNSRTLQDAGQQHFEDVLGLAPNINWAAGSSRPRYFQIRGIGEREQYEGAPNPSVGFLIDDIDFSGIGMPATLFDVKQIEVLRGPQGTRYGANALAGLIAVRGNDPENEVHYGVEASSGDYRTRSLGLTATAPIASLNSAWRLSLQQYRSDGFRTNPYLHRNDTDGRDELTGRFKWRWQADDTKIDFTLLHANLDNGYDAFAIDNSRTSLSDKPGKDAQRSTGAALKINQALQDMNLTVIGATASSHSVQSYDGDWGNPQSWRNLMHTWAVQHAADAVDANAWPAFVYDYTYRVDRYRDTYSLELRLASEHDVRLNWLIGVYALDLNEHIKEHSQGEYADPVAYDHFSSLDDWLDSHYDARNTALFGELNGLLAPRWSWSVGLRGEQRAAKYRDARTSLDPLPPALNEHTRESMWGGQASLSVDIANASKAYLAVSRGYKAGGFNLGFATAATPKFSQETLLSYELGLKGSALNDRLYFDMAAFYEQRHNMQVLDSKQLVQGDPNSFVFFTGNVGSGYNTGVESSLRLRVSNAVELGGSLGLLKTRTDRYVQGDGEVVPSRAQAHAPDYTAGVYGVWHMTEGWMARVDVTAKDSFYYSNAPSIQRSNAYTLTHIKAGYEAPRWQVHAWVRNVFNKDYTTRAFEFGNEPPDFNSALYVQHGEPRQLGVTVNIKL